MENEEIIVVETPRDVSIELLFSKILEIIKELKEDGFNPSSIFFPRKYYSEMDISIASLERDSILYSKIVRKESGIYLLYDENTDLRLFFPLNIASFDDIVILDKSVGIWTYKVDERNGERLFIDISEYEKDKSMVDLYVRTLINLRIINPRRARILRFQ